MKKDCDNRVDPEDDNAYTWEELSAYYLRWFELKDIEYWQACLPQACTRSFEAVAQLDEAQAIADKLYKEAQNATHEQVAVRSQRWQRSLQLLEHMRQQIVVEEIAIKDRHPGLHGSFAHGGKMWTRSSLLLCMD